MALEGTPPGHAAGDSDEVPGDGDKAVPHHHTVGHNHEMGVPVRDLAAVAFPRLSLPAVDEASTPPTGFLVNADLRPPIA